MSDAPTVSAIIAAFNEAPSIGATVTDVTAATPGLVEIIVVDDGSRDGTAAAAEAAGARVVRFPQNRGKGAALRAGIAAATGDLLLFLDADGQDDPAEIPLLLDALAPEVDMVIGSRFMGRFLPGAVTPVNHAGNRVLTTIFNLLFGTHLTDTQAGFRLVRRSRLHATALTATEYEIETDITLNVHTRGGHIVEVGVTRARRNHGASRFIRWRHGVRILARMLAGRIGRPRAAAQGLRP